MEFSFLGFGTMNGKDGKPFKTRDGGVMRLETLMDSVNEQVYEKMKENRDIPDEEAKETSRTVGLAAIKYGDLSNQASKDYVFDIERFTSFEGNTGPYILYTIVRIKSILKKYEEIVGLLGENGTIRSYPIDSQINLMLEITKFSETIADAYGDSAPHKICKYIYDLSNAFNTFYHENKIIAEEDKEKQESWITLIGLVLHILETCINILGFEAPERM